MVFTSSSRYSSTYLGLTLLLLKLTQAEETTTITHTNYITPPCFQNQIATALSNNPQGLTGGIPIVFVTNVEEESENNAGLQPTNIQTVVTSSDFHYTVSTDSTALDTVTSCSNNRCSTVVSSKAIPYVYTTQGNSIYTTTSTGDMNTQTNTASTQTQTNQQEPLSVTDSPSIGTDANTKKSTSLTTQETSKEKELGMTKISSSKSGLNRDKGTSSISQTNHNPAIDTHTKNQKSTSATIETHTKNQDLLSATITSSLSRSSQLAHGADNKDTSVNDNKSKAQKSKGKSSKITEAGDETESQHYTLTKKNDPNSVKKSTIYDYETESETGSHTVTETQSARAKILKIAKTTTKTIYKATSTPKTIYKPTTTTETKTTTERNPLITESAVKKTLTVSIETSDFTKGRTLSSSKSSSKISSKDSSKYSSNISSDSSSTFLSNPSSIPSSNSTLQVSSNEIRKSSISTLGSINSTSAAYNTVDNSGSVSAIPSTTSTIDLRISSSLALVSASHQSYSSKTFANGSSSSFVISTLTRAHSTPLSSSASSAGNTFTDVTYVADVSSTSATTSIKDDSSTRDLTSTTGATSSAEANSLTDATISISVSKSVGISISSSDTECAVTDLFEAIATDEPSSIFPREELPLTIPDGVSNDDIPYQTNKFYANLFLDEQTDMIWSYPYGLYWKTQDYYGFGVQHTNTSDRIFGSQDTNNDDVDSYYYNPTNNAEVIFSSPSFSNDSNYLSVSEMKTMSVLVTLSAEKSIGSDYVDIPIVQGMGFVTGIYHGDLVPELDSLIGFDSLNQESSDALSSSTLKYRATLFNGVEWLIYVTLPSSDDADEFELKASSSYKLTGSSLDGVVIQVAVAPEKSSQDGYYDQAAGKYPTKAELKGYVSACDDAQYGFKYSVNGTSSSDKTIIFALPHHVESLTDETSDTSTGIKLASTTKGNMYGYLTNEIIMSESLQIDIGFLPWAQNMNGSLSYDTDQLKLLAETANTELAVDINETVQVVDSTYSSGKLLDKYAYLLLVVSDIIEDEKVTNSTLSDMKDAFEPFFNNNQYFKLMYDTKFGGVTSTASQDGDTGADYGAGYYNDHHFHYGYYVHAAAVVGYVDKKLGGTWAEDNKEWVNTLIRDVANPSDDDSYFPVSRMFDWFAGHSWAAGLFASGDGKNEESSSEDYNFAYGMKLWGSVVENESMEARGDLMLSIMRRAMNKYFYYRSDNDVEPSEIIENKVSGIFFDNKVTYTTYFGTPDEHPEYVHGIHMLPITPVSSYLRGDFAQQEWNDQITTFIDNVDSGWLGILRLNQALFDAQSSYDFFSSDDWNSDYLDNGQSRTWSLAFSGGLSNAT